MRSDGVTKRRSAEGKAFRLDELRKGIKPFRLHWFPRLGSTNDHAALLRRQGDLYAPAMVLTGCQTAGRGRGENSWWSRAGVLTVTFAFPIHERIAPHQLPLLAGLAVRDAAAAIAPKADVQLKWPNDLLIDGRKLAGLLCERVHKADLVGLGMNVDVDPREAPHSLRGKVTSLAEWSVTPLDITGVLIEIARGLHGMLTHQNERTFGEHLRQYDQHHALLGRRVRISDDGAPACISGKCEGLDPMGRLLLRDGKTLHRVIAGHVLLL